MPPSYVLYYVQPDQNSETATIYIRPAGHVVQTLSRASRRPWLLLVVKINPIRRPQTTTAIAMCAPTIHFLHSPIRLAVIICTACMDWELRHAMITWGITVCTALEAALHCSPGEIHCLATNLRYMYKVQSPDCRMLCNSHLGLYRSGMHAVGNEVMYSASDNSGSAVLDPERACQCDLPAIVLARIQSCSFFH